VKAGEAIARAGQSGAVAEPQLHFELRRGRTPVDPARVIGGR
jgi:septal ring factor EnvC (AmiA/AmiB activator)